MTKPKQELRQKEYRQQVERLYQTIAGPKGAARAKRILADFLTPAEQRMLHRRWHIASLLETGDNVRQVAQKAKVSTLTVMRVKNLRKRSWPGLRQALKAKGHGKTKKAFRPKTKRVASRLVFGQGKK